MVIRIPEICGISDHHSPSPCLPVHTMVASNPIPQQPSNSLHQKDPKRRNIFSRGFLETSRDRTCLEVRDPHNEVACARWPKYPRDAKRCTLRVRFIGAIPDHFKYEDTGQTFVATRDYSRHV